VKQSALKLCIEGFQTLSYLKTKANAEIDFNNLKKAESVAVKPKSTISGVKHADLYQQLKKWRDDLAGENNVPVYQVLPQKVLTDLVNKLPSNFEQLESIKGIGKMKVKQYGNELLIMIADFCEKKEISQTPFQVLISTKSPKVDTKKLSLDLFKEGRSVVEIAAQRGFTTSTIETHLTHFLETGEVLISDFMEESKVELIENYVLNHQPKSMNDTKAALGNDISYGEIKAVMTHLGLRNEG
jgi:ribonuclease D